MEFQYDEDSRSDVSAVEPEVDVSALDGMYLASSGSSLLACLSLCPHLWFTPFAHASQTHADNEATDPTRLLLVPNFCRIMPDLGLDEEGFAAFHWNVTDWNSLDTRITSPEFECAGYRFRILLFPWGNGPQQSELVSLYLDCSDFSNPLPRLQDGAKVAVAASGEADLPSENSSPPGTIVPKGKKRYNDHICIQFALAMSNPSDPTTWTSMKAEHRYTAEETDWGFTRFADLRGLGNVLPGKSRPIIERQAVRISAYVRAIKDEKGVLWHNFINYDSKRTTGYVGMRNQGATCYMNSLLQSLFCTNMFRRAVYEIPTENDVPSDSVALALQRVFYHLQSSDQPVGTTELTKSFGWKSLDSFLQHDVQEFNRVLQDKLESKMKGTAADGMIGKLFVGKMKSYIKCINVDYESSRVEDFYDIQLNVKGMRNLQDSFKNYVQVERLDGDNQYQAEGYGLQDAMKGVIFESLPPVLHLQLKRFEYDMERDMMVKINDRHEFPLEIDLGDFIDKDSPMSGEDWKFSLHGVLVHAGDLSGGHYFALLKPEKDGEWFKFDDDRVTPATEREVLEDNFGGEPRIRGQPPPPLSDGQRPVKRFTNAYMLVYIRNSELNNVLKPFGPSDTPAHLAKRIEQERLELEARRREREEQHLYLSLCVLTLENFQRYQGFDLAKGSDRIPTTLLDVPTFRIPRGERYQSAKAQLAEHLHLDPSEFRVWNLVNRQNHTIRPDEVLPDDDPALTMEEIRERMSARALEVRIFIEPLALVPRPALAKPSYYSMLLLKHFDVVNQTLLGAGHVYVKNSDTVSSLCPAITQLMKWPASTVVRLYEEVKPRMIDLMDQEKTFSASEIQNGDIICFQEAIPDSTAKELQLKGMCSDPVQFYDFLNNNVRIVFKPLPGTSGDKEFSLALHKQLPYESLALRVAAMLDADPHKLRFTTAHGPSRTPLLPLKSNTAMAVCDIAVTSYPDTTSDTGAVAYYEVLDVLLEELESKRSLKVYWMGLNNKEEDERKYLLHKDTTFTDLHHLLAEEHKLGPHPSVPCLVPAEPEESKDKVSQGEVALVSQNLPLDPESIAYNLRPATRVRLSQISENGRTQVPFNASETIEHLADETELYAEEIPGDEMEVIYARSFIPRSELTREIVTVSHFTKDPSFGKAVPFRFVLYSGETLDDLKKRMRARLALGAKEFDKIKFARLHARSYRPAEYLSGTDVPFDLINPTEHLLGLDHVDRSPRSHRLAIAAALDHGIHIRS